MRYLSLNCTVLLYVAHLVNFSGERAKPKIETIQMVQHVQQTTTHKRKENQGAYNTMKASNNTDYIQEHGRNKIVSGKTGLPH